MLFVIDKPKFQRTIAIVRDDRVMVQRDFEFRRAGFSE